VHPISIVFDSQNAVVVLQCSAPQAEPQIFLPCVKVILSGSCDENSCPVVVPTFNGAGPQQREDP